MSADPPSPHPVARRPPGRPARDRDRRRLGPRRGGGRAGWRPPAPRSPASTGARPRAASAASRSTWPTAGPPRRRSPGWPSRPAGCGPSSRAPGVDVPGRLDDVDAEVWERTVAVNLLGTAAVVRAALPWLRPARGRVVTVASTLGHRAVSDATAYCASKFGVVGFTRALTAELRGEVGVTMLTPGGMQTAFFDEREERYKPPADLELCDPAQVADAVHFALTRPAGLRGPRAGRHPLQRVVLALSAPPCRSPSGVSAGRGREIDANRRNVRKDVRTGAGGPGSGRRPGPAARSARPGHVQGAGGVCRLHTRPSGSRTVISWVPQWVGSNGVTTSTTGSSSSAARWRRPGSAGRPSACPRGPRR